MQCKTQLILLAEYNTVMNQQLYQVAAQLSPETLGADKKAFFKSILGSYNHIMVGDLIWLRRFTQYPTSFDLLTVLHSFPTPQRLDEILYADFAALWQKRTQLDQIIEQWTSSLDEDTLGRTLAYNTMKGVPAKRILLSLLMHFFTHQIHHRGQITTLLAQEGLDFGETDLLLIIPNIEP